MIYADEVMETTTSTSTATVILGGASASEAGARTFVGAGITVGATGISAKIGPDTNGAWLTGAYTLTDATTLTRTAIKSSSAAGNADVTLAAGTKNVSCVLLSADIVDKDNAATLTNKRIQDRVSTVAAPGATPSVNTDNFDRLTLTGLAASITSITVTGTPVAGDKLTIDFTDNGSSRNISWGASFESSSIALPVATVAAQKLSTYFDWNPVTSKWRCVGVA